MRSTTKNLELFSESPLEKVAYNVIIVIIIFSSSKFSEYTISFKKWRLVKYIPIIIDKKIFSENNRSENSLTIWNVS
jgi:hypothetical protein